MLHLEKMLESITRRLLSIPFDLNLFRPEFLTIQFAFLPQVLYSLPVYMA